MKLADLVDESAEGERIATGFIITERPIRMSVGPLHFSDMPGDKRRPCHPTESVTVLRDPSNKCNGLCPSVDECLLYINDTGRAHIRVFDVGSKHGLSNGRVFAENIGDGDLAKGGLVDGMKLDERGNVYVTGPDGVWVIGPDGEHLGTIGVPESVGNINWGEDGWSSLFIPATTSVYRVRMKVARNRLGYMN